MRLLIAADIFPPQSGGPATYAVTLANELTKQGVEVKIVSLNPQSDSAVVSCPLYRVSFKNKRLRYFEYFWLLFKHAWSADIIYAMGPVNAGWPAMWVNRLYFKKKKFVVKVVGDYAWEQGVIKSGVKESVDEFQNKQYSEFVGRLQAAERQTVRAADLVIVPSNYLRQMVIKWGADEKKVKIIYNAVEFKDVPAMQKPAGERWIVSAGRLVPWKGMAALVEIMPEIVKTVPNAKLKIAGGGPEEKNLRSKIEDLRLGNQAELVGHKTHEETLSYLKAADVFVLNSGYEGLSHAILEALTFGKPVLASKIGGNPEIVIPGQTGDLFEYNNKAEVKEKIIHFLVNHFVPAKQPEFFNQFALENMVEKTKNTLGQLTDTNQLITNNQ